jgi:hypothetical protein
VTTEEKLASHAEHSSSKQLSQSATLHTFANGITHAKQVRKHVNFAITVDIKHVWLQA